MRMRRIFAAALLLSLALSLNAPARAIDNGGEDPPASGITEQEFEEPEKSEEPEEFEDPEESGGMEAPEGPEDSEEPETFEDPEEFQEPNAFEDPEEFKDPEKSEGMEAPEDPEEFEEPNAFEEPEEFEESEASEAPEEFEDPEDVDGAEPMETAELEDMMIDVVVPTTGEIVLNPYRLEVEECDGSTAQIIHQPQPLSNQSAFPVEVNVSIVGTVAEGSEAAFVYGTPRRGEKEVFLYAEFQNDPDGWLETYTGAPNQLIAAEERSDSEYVLTLEAEGEGYFRLSGAMAEGIAWEDTDTFGAVLVFTFSTVPEEEAMYAESPDAGAVFVGPMQEGEPWLEPENDAEIEDPAGQEIFPGPEAFPEQEIFPEPEAFPEQEIFPEPEAFPEPEEAADADTDELAASSAWDES